MKVLLVTTWGIACGIAETAAHLKAAIEQADPGIQIIPDQDALDPAAAYEAIREVDLVHLNFHAALHSRWVPEQIHRAKKFGQKVLVTFHDSGVPNSDQCKE